MDLVKVFAYGERLRDDEAVVSQRGDQALRIDREVVGLALLATVAQQVLRYRRTRSRGP
jgi:hypothetical protein